MESPNKFPTFEEHRDSWQELARGIASLRGQVREAAPSGAEPGPLPGELIIIGSGIETVGFTLGDQQLIESADKVLFCVADPATIVWLKQIRPDALDLYVLYGENKVRYTTYMQMTEAQLYWVRQGLKVVVVFYGHPGIFVLSTHRAIKIARREGYKAVMKASVSALDTLCADLGVDPSHPGLQTHEATDALIRQRKPDPSLHVVLWQVGVIGELGYRHQGYLNNHFSYFIKWLQGIYGDDYEITHYVGSRYPTIPPLIENYKLSELHNPENQKKIAGLSTFYIPPRDVTQSDPEILQYLGLLGPGLKLVKPSSPLREIGAYGPKEMKAFDEFATFRIPSSYTWQAETGASKFLIELRLDPALQEHYERDPVGAVSGPRFHYLSDREKAMLASRDSGVIQIACKGLQERSPETEQFVAELLTSKKSARSLAATLRAGHGGGASALNSWLAKRGMTIEARQISRSIDFVQRNALYPWTGVFLEPEAQLLFTIVGNRRRRADSLIYINGERISTFSYDEGCIRWKAEGGNSTGGFLRPDVDSQGRRRILGKVWKHGEQAPAQSGFTAAEVDPERAPMFEEVKRFCKTGELAQMYAEYAVRIGGHAGRQADAFQISKQGLAIDGEPVQSWDFANGVLTWDGGRGVYRAGEIRFLLDPILRSVELFGRVSPADGADALKCYGSSLLGGDGAYSGPAMPPWAQTHLAEIVRRHSAHGGLMLWHRWEQQNYTSRIVNTVVSRIN
jgi:Tetrapyrrole (Corrin/Porphyrin) Methylases